MPQIIRYIDAIAREKQRGVLLIEFRPQAFKNDWLDYDYQDNKRRDEVLMWLDKNNIPWEKCGPFVTKQYVLGYFGDVYIDVPYDESNEQYELVREYLENPDGSMRDPEVIFCYLALEHAMQNAHQDEPGYWDKVWGE
jgi:hypothetical protein